MKWGKTVGGQNCHMVVNGKAYCGQFKIDVVLDTDHVPENERCRNCDEKLRRKGQEQRKSLPPPPKTVYEPQHTIDDWERGDT